METLRKTSITILLVSSITLVIVCSSLLYKTKKEVSNLSNTLTVLQARNDKTQQIADNYKLKTELNSTETTTIIKNNIKAFFNAQYNYTNEDFLSRYNAIKQYTTEKLYNQITAGNTDIIPSVNIKSKIISIDIFVDYDTLSNIKANVVMTSNYSINGVEKPNDTELYALAVKKDENNKYIITDFASKGYVIQ